MVISRAQIYFDIIIFICRNVYCMITAIGKALRYHKCIPLICFDPLSLLCQHCGRGQNFTVDPLFYQFVVQEKSQTPGLIIGALLLYAVIPVTIVFSKTQYTGKSTLLQM